MQHLLARFTTVLSLLAIVTSLQAQTFRYDTVPDPRNNNTERQLFTVEQPQQTVQKKQNVQPTESQPKIKSGFNKDKLIFGGTFGLTFGDYTAFNISPQIGYEVSKYFTWGGGLGYSYYKWNDYPKDISYNYLGANIYGRVNPIHVIALQVQPEIYRLWGSQVDSRTVPCVLAGGGVYLPMGHGAMSMMLYYDLVQDPYSPYLDQVVYSIGYVFNF